MFINTFTHIIYKARRIKILPMAVLLVLVSSFSLPAQIEEYKIKAAYLEKFSRFLEWPPEAEITDTTKAFHIDVIGYSPITEPLRELYQKNKIRNKDVVIRQIQHISQLKNCHILFVGKENKSRLGKILKLANKMGIVTISDSKGFCESGVLINFFVENDKVLFEINYDSVRKSKIHISYLLLKLARITGKKENVF